MKIQWKSEEYINRIKKKLTLTKMIVDYTNNWLKPSTIRLYDGNNFLPTAQYIYNAVKKEDRVLPEETLDFKLNSDVTYRPAQQTILNRIKVRKEDKKPFGLIYGKTWIGKTIIQMGIIDLYKCKTLIVCPNKALTAQMVDDFKKFSNYEIWKYDSTKKDVKDITVTTLTSFVKKEWDFGYDYDLLLIDECHKWITPKFIKALTKCPAKCLYWLSGTPYNDFFEAEERKDWTTKYWLSYIYGEVIEDPENWDYMYTPDFTFYDYVSAWDYEFEEYHELRSCLSHDETRLEKQVKVVSNYLKDREVVMILSDRRRELQYYYDYFSENSWINTVLITGDTKPDEDNALIKECLKKDKKLIIIWTDSKLWTWFDLSVIDTVCMFQAVKQMHTVVQCVWRWMRYIKWKLNPVVIFWNDQVLKKQKTEKKKIIKKEYWVSEKDIKQFTIKSFI